MRMIFRTIQIVAALSLLIGCATPQKDVARAAAICNEAGQSKGDAGYEQCISRQVAAIQEQRKDVEQVIAVGLQTYGASAQQQPAYSSSPSYRRPVRCTSSTVGGTVYTNCY